MFLWRIRRIFGLVVALALPGSAQAALEVCNDTGAQHSVAISYKSQTLWRSQGWWTLSPGDCAETFAGPLTERFFYLRVESEGWSFQDDKLSFCVDDGDFAIEGNETCARRGFRREDFARIDTGVDATKFRHLLSDNLTPDHDTPHRAQGRAPAFRWNAVFQGCQIAAPPYQSFCTFIGDGQRFLVYEDDRITPALWARLQNLPRGRRVALTGQRQRLFETTVGLVLQSATVLDANRADRILAQLQGQWRSLDDANDSFRVSGAERISTYAGAATTVEYISIRDHCAQASGQGPYLFTWDNDGGSRLCYRIAEASEQEIELEYLSTGNLLTYRREATTH